MNLGIARDTPESMREHLAPALEADLLVTTAGISVGEHDYLREVLAELGAEQRFWRLRMRPGAPVGFGMLGSVPWIGLPGNPVSTMVTFELFVRPAIRRMAGHELPFRRSVPVRLGEAVSLKPRLQHFPSGHPDRDAGGTGGTAHRPPGVRHSDVDGARRRAAGDSRGPARHPRRRHRCRPSGWTSRPTRASRPSSTRALDRKSASHNTLPPVRSG